MVHFMVSMVNSGSVNTNNGWGIDINKQWRQVHTLLGCINTKQMSWYSVVLAQTTHIHV